MSEESKSASNLHKGSESGFTAKIPFDLNSLFSLQYSFDTLKAALEWLAGQQAGLDVRIRFLEENKLDEKEYFQNKSEVNKYHERNEIDKENLNKKNGVQDNRISSLEGEIELLKSLGAPSGGGGDTSGMLDALKGMNEKLRSEF